MTWKFKYCKQIVCCIFLNAKPGNGGARFDV